MEENKRKEAIRNARKKIEEALKKVPTRERFTKEELSKKIDMPQPTERIHWERVEESERVQTCYPEE